MNPKDEAIFKRAMANAPQPIGEIKGSVDSRDKLRELIFGTDANPRNLKLVGVVAPYRLLSRVFPSDELHPADFGLFHINGEELKEWASKQGLSADYLAGTEGMSLRPIHFQFL